MTDSCVHGPQVKFQLASRLSKAVFLHGQTCCDCDDDDGYRGEERADCISSEEWEDRTELFTETLENLHMTIFGIMVCFISQILFVVKVGHNSVHLWHECEHRLTESLEKEKRSLQECAAQGQHRNFKPHRKDTREKYEQLLNTRGGVSFPDMTPLKVTKFAQARFLLRFDRLKLRFVRHAYVEVRRPFLLILSRPPPCRSCGGTACSCALGLLLPPDQHARPHPPPPPPDQHARPHPPPPQPDQHARPHPPPPPSRCVVLCYAVRRDDPTKPNQQQGSVPKAARARWAGDTDWDAVFAQTPGEPDPKRHRWIPDAMMDFDMADYFRQWQAKVFEELVEASFCWRCLQARPASACPCLCLSESSARQLDAVCR
jgi:hypothetical protein